MDPAGKFLVSPLRGLLADNPISHRFRGGIRCFVPPGLPGRIAFLEQIRMLRTYSG